VGHRKCTVLPHSDCGIEPKESFGLLLGVQSQRSVAFLGTLPAKKGKGFAVPYEGEGFWGTEALEGLIYIWAERSGFRHCCVSDADPYDGAWRQLLNPFLEAGTLRSGILVQVEPMDLSQLECDHVSLGLRGTMASSTT